MATNYLLCIDADDQAINIFNVNYNKVKIINLVIQMLDSKSQFHTLFLQQQQIKLGLFVINNIDTNLINSSKGLNHNRFYIFTIAEINKV